LCTALRNIDIHGNMMSDRSLEVLAQNLPLRLEVLNLLGSQHEFTEAALKTLAAHIPPLVNKLTLNPDSLDVLINMQTREGVEQFMRYIQGDNDVRRSVKDEIKAAEEAEAKALQDGPQIRDIDGIKCHSCIKCFDDRDLGLYGFAGIWQLSLNEPVVNGAPHYQFRNAEAKNHTNQLWHLYRYVNPTTGVCVWRIGPTPGGNTSAAATYISDSLDPTNIKAKWRINTRNGLMKDEDMKFGEAL